MKPTLEEVIEFVREFSGDHKSVILSIPCWMLIWVLPEMMELSCWRTRRRSLGFRL